MTYFNKDGQKWARSTGTGWNIAYQPSGETMTGAASYASNILLADGMDIIIDVSENTISNGIRENLGQSKKQCKQCRIMTIGSDDGYERTKATEVSAAVSLRQTNVY